MLAKKEGKSGGPYVRKMKGYLEQLERLGYVLPQDIIVGLILNDLTSDFAGFVRNYNMHYMGKTVERQTKDDACHHCKEVGHWKRNCTVYLVELIMKKKQVGTASSLEISRRAEKLEEIQEEDTSPSENTSEISMDVEGFEPPQEEVVPIDMSIVIHRAPDRLCLNVEVDEHSLGDLNEPTNYKAAILDLKPDK
nr:zinc finger, CCHC-type [Tanacetum cinerariifolium]